MKQFLDDIVRKLLAKFGMDPDIGKKSIEIIENP